jgi:hypothetical protein
MQQLFSTVSYSFPTVAAHVVVAGSTLVGQPLLEILISEEHISEHNPNLYEKLHQFVI